MAHCADKCFPLRGEWHANAEIKSFPLRGEWRTNAGIKSFPLRGEWHAVPISAFPFGESGTQCRERISFDGNIIKSLRTLRRKFKFHPKLGEGGALRRKRGARRLKISDKISDNQLMTYFYCFIRTYFKSEEAPLCRIEFQLITTSHGNGISPNLTEYL